MTDPAPSHACPGVAEVVSLLDELVRYGVTKLDDPYLLFDDVCDLTRIKPKTMRALRAKGEGPPFFKRGQILTIRRSAALAWFRETYEDAPLA